MAVSEKTREFEVGGKKYLVRHPEMQEHIEADKIYKKTWNEELQSGSLLRNQLETELRARDLWSDKQEQEYQTLRTEVIDLEFALAKGGIKLSEAKSIALKMKEKRGQMISLLSTRTDLDSNTCEGRADSAKFNYLMVKCILNAEDKSPVFPGGVAEYISRQDEEIAEKGATEFYYLMSDSGPSEGGVTEDKFLKKYKFVNKDNRLIDKDGRLIDMDGRHIDEKGFYIKWISEKKSVKVDINGRELDKDGEFIVEFSPFLDEEDNPIEEEKPKKRTRKKDLVAAAPAEEATE